MTSKSGSAMPDSAGDSKRAISRREMVRRLALGASAGAAFPASASSQPVTSHLADAATADSRKRELAEWTPRFFDAHQNATFAILSERIVPGSAQAQVNRFVDLLASVDTLSEQQKLLASLGTMDAEALRRYSRPFQNLAESEQNEILTVASTGAASSPELTTEELSLAQMNLRDHFENLKNWIQSAYYTSEVGMKELGWNGEVFFASFPGCPHGDTHD